MLYEVVTYMNNRKNTALTVFITFVVTTALYLGAYIVVPDAGGIMSEIRSIIVPSGFSGGGDFAEVKKLIDANFIEDSDDTKLNSMAIKGYVAALNDEYSEYYTKQEYLSLSASLTGNYKGIGIEVSVDADNRIVITNVYKGSPALEAGLKAGDIIEKVEGKSYDGSTLNGAVNAIRTADEDAAPVTITVIRDGKSLDVSVERREVSIPATDSQMLEGDIGYISLYQFSEDANESFRTEVNTLISSGAKSLIIDLRDNPGGMLTTVVDIADLLLPKGNILTIKGRNTEKEEFMSGDTHVDIPLYVLINGGSASASEVLAGALKDHKRATLIGEKSYGKGVVQSVYELGSGGALKLTTAKYYTPGGTCIDGEGIEPDYTVEFSVSDDYEYSKETDPQLQKAIELIKTK